MLSAAEIVPVLKVWTMINYEYFILYFVVYYMRMLSHYKD
jgi:hypothetical protein